jgi:hypothetical protein
VTAHLCEQLGPDKVLLPANKRKVSHQRTQSPGFRTSGAPALAMAIPRLFLRLLDGVAAESKLSLVCNDALDDDCASNGAVFLRLGVSSSSASSGLMRSAPAPAGDESAPN